MKEIKKVREREIYIWSLQDEYVLMPVYLKPAIEVNFDDFLLFYLLYGVIIFRRSLYYGATISA